MAFNEQLASFRQQWLAIVASVTALLAIFGINLPAPRTPDSDGRSNAQIVEKFDSTTGINRPATITPHEWEDPLDELERIFAEKAPGNPSEDLIHGVLRGKQPELVRKILRESLQQESTKTELLITIQVVPGQARLNSKEARTLWGHAFRLALSDEEFSLEQENYLASFECEIQTAIPGQGDLKRSITLPMRLYKKPIGSGAGESGKGGAKHAFLLNFWLVEDYLGKAPWGSLKAVRDAIVQQLIPSDITSNTWAIIGPGRSGILQAMEPAWQSIEDVMSVDAKLPGEIFFEENGSTKPIYWVNAHCTVPLKTLWKQKGKSKGGQKIEWIQATPDDEQMLKLLAGELRTRLAPAGIPAIQAVLSSPGRANQQRSVLLFYEQDSEFGKNLCTTLRKELTESKTNKNHSRNPSESWTFDCRLIPYLRGVGFVSGTAQDPNAVDSSSSQVADYFRRTLEEEPLRLVDALEKKEQPLAIGILGGELPDKLALLREVRARYPQSLVFTNDLKIQYLNPDTLPLFRNVVVAAHAALKQEFRSPFVPTPGQPPSNLSDGVSTAAPDDGTLEDGAVGKRETSVSFRDEVQATLWMGYRRLFAKVFPGSGPSPEGAGEADSTRALKDPIPAAVIVEVGNRAFWESSQSRSSWLQRLFGGLCIFLLFAFPWMHRRWTIGGMSRDSALELGGHKEPQFFMEAVAQRKLPSQVLKETTRIWKNLPLVVTCLIVFVACCWPVNALSEAEWIKPGQGFLSQMGTLLVNNTMTLFTGVSVVPSILILVLCLPFTFWPALKKEIERTVFQDHSLETVRAHEEQGMESRLENIGKLVGQVGGRHDDFETPGSTREMEKVDWSDWRKYLSGSTRAPILYGAFGLLAGVVIGWYTGRHWVLQISLLASISSSLVRSLSARNAIWIAFLTCMGIELFAWLFSDYSTVPARDNAVRAIGSNVFSVAYWWLLVGLVKLFIQQFHLRQMLRDATRHVTKAISANRIKAVDLDVLAKNVDHVDQLMIRIQDASRLISRDLLHLTVVGLFICFARMPWFDAWGMSVATWLTIVLPMAAPFVSSIRLRQTAFGFRGACHRYLNDLEYLCSGKPEGNVGLELTERWHKRIDSHNRGVFSPLDQDPLISIGLSLLVAFSSGPQGDLIRKMMGFFMI